MREIITATHTVPSRVPLVTKTNSELEMIDKPRRRARNNVSLSSLSDIYSKIKTLVYHEYK